MRALFAYGAEVPGSRVIADHRRWLVPVGAVLAINVLVLIFVVVPLRQSAQSGEARANVSALELREAAADLANAEATRDGQSQASQDLERFYRDVLPADFTTARRITHVKLAQLARSHDVTLERGSATPETVRDSSLERLHVNYSLTGDWDDVRQLIYDIETGADFIVIDNVGLSEGADAQAGLSLILDLSTYYRSTSAPGAQGGDGR